MQKSHYLLPVSLLLLLSILFFIPRHAAAIGHPTLVKDIYPGSSGSSPSLGPVLNGYVLFSAMNELWRSDGTADGTQQVKDICPGLVGSSPTGFVILNGRVFFSANDCTNGKELWATDGTTGGTTLVKDINPGAAASNPSLLTVSNGALFFVATTAANGTELWKSDGTADGTVLLKEFTVGSAGSTIDSLTDSAGLLMVVVRTGTSTYELWKSDGTPEGTLMVRGFTSLPQYLAGCSGRTFFNCGESYGQELWVTDGTAAGTMLVKDINPGTSSSYPDSFACFNGTLYFNACDPTNWCQLWKSDGTASGTTLVKVLKAGGGAWPSNMTELNAVLIFRAEGSTGWGLWKTDGTAEGTQLVKDVDPGAISDPRYQTSGGRAFLNGGSYPWVTDGTTEGTFRLGVHGIIGYRTYRVLGNVALYAGDDPVYGNELMAISLVPAPHSLITSPSSGSVTKDSSVTITGEAHSDTGSPIATVEISADGGATWHTATGTTSWSYVWSPPSEGRYAFLSRATDSAGMVESPEPAITIDVDRTPPSGSVVINSNAEVTTTANVTLTIDADPADPGVTCTGNYPRRCGTTTMRFSNDGVSWSAWLTSSSTSYSWTLQAGDGPKTVFMDLQDRAGNVSSFSDTILFDTGLSPRSTITQPATGLYTNQGTITISGTATPGQGATLVRVEVSTNGGSTWTTATGTDTWTKSVSLAHGAYTIKSRGVDTAGTTEVPGAGISVTVDTQAPTGGIWYNYNYDRYELNADAMTPGMACLQIFPNLCGQMEMQIPGYAWQTATMVLPYGTSSLALRDRAGNTSFISGVTTYGYPVRLGESSSFYPSIQQGCTNAATGSVVKLTATPFTENLTFNRGVSVTMSGGYNNTFSAVTGTTPITGTLDVNGDQVELQNLDLQGAITVTRGSVSANVVSVN